MKRAALKGLLNNLDMLSKKDIERLSGDLTAANLRQALRTKKTQLAVLRLISRIKSAQSLVAAENEGLIEAIVNLVDSPDKKVVALASKVLSLIPAERTGQDSLYQVALHSLNPENKSSVPADRKASVELLGTVGDSQSANHILQVALKDRIQAVRNRAWITLAGLGDSGKKMLIAEGQKAANRLPRTPAQRLYGYGRSRHGQTKPFSMDPGLVKALGQITDRKATSVLLRIVRNEGIQERLREMGIKALMTNLNRTSINALVAIADKRLESRPEIIACLISRGGPQAESGLRKIAEAMPVITVGSNAHRIFRNRESRTDFNQRMARKRNRNAVLYLLAVTQKGDKEAKAALIAMKGKAVTDTLCDLALHDSCEKMVKAAKSVLRQRCELKEFRRRLMEQLDLAK